MNVAKKVLMPYSFGISTFFSFADKLQVGSTEFSNLNAPLSFGDTIIIEDACSAVYYAKSNVRKVTFRYLKDGENLSHSYVKTEIRTKLLNKILIS